MDNDVCNLVTSVFQGNESSRAPNKPIGGQNGGCIPVIYLISFLMFSHLTGGCEG